MTFVTKGASIFCIYFPLFSPNIYADLEKQWRSTYAICSTHFHFNSEYFSIFLFSSNSTITVHTTYEYRVGTTFSIPFLV